MRFSFLALTFVILKASTPFGLAESSSAPSGQDLVLQGWEQASIFLFDEAHQSFRKAEGQEGVNERDRRLGEAVTLLALQPRTQGNILAAERILEQLGEENPHDATGLAARFHRARVHENHLTPPDIQTARVLYEGVISDASGNPLAELAAARLVLLDLFAAGNEPAALAAAEKRLRPLGETLQTDIGRREFHSAMGMSINLLRGDPQTALDHLMKATRFSFPMPQQETEILLVAGALAEEIGDYELARSIYTRFVDNFSRDSRNYSVRRLLEDLPAPQPSL